ncbi:conserved hypothetical protein [Ricinus communis]|uniref:Uncharacterized protein n=1 Tax=Ricinus communis TaxID=3988 RepID=B9SDV1_RICCO|nr:conserved hypothetical protein [Ricinus communis]
MDNGDGIVVGWLGHLTFRDKEGYFVDGDGIVRADVLFRRAESKYSVKQVGITIEFYGGELNRVNYSNPATSKGLVYFWTCFIRSALFFGHIWHGARTLFKDVFTGIDPNLDVQVEFGAFQKIGGPTTRTQVV